MMNNTASMYVALHRHGEFRKQMGTETHLGFSPISTRSRRDRIGILIEARNAQDAVIKIRQAEQAGIQQIWSQSIGFTDQLTLFAAAAVQTEKVRLGTAIVPIYPRHPVALAQQALALHDLAPGRLRLGMGPGNQMLVENWLGLAQTSPLSYLKEYLEVMRSILWKKTTAYHGRFFNISNDNPVVATISATLREARVPLLISAVGSKAFQLAGEIAEGAISWASPTPYLLNTALPALRAGAELGQRPVPPIIAHIKVILSTDEKAVQAAMLPRIRTAAQFGPYARVFAQAGYPNAAAGNSVELEALVQTLVISGDEETVRNRIHELLANGLDELMLDFIPIIDEIKEREQLLHLIGSL